MPVEVAATHTGSRRRGRGTTGTARNGKRWFPATSGRPDSHLVNSSSESWNPCVNRSVPVPKTSRSTQGPPRPTPSRNRPPDSSCSSAASSPTATGCRLDRMHAAVPTAMRRVAPSRCAAKVIADGQTP